MKSKQNAVHLTAELLEAAIRSLGEAILIKDARGTILVGSQLAAEIYGCSVEDLPGLDGYEALPARVRNTVRDRDRQVLETGESETLEEIWDFGYEERTVLVTRSRIETADGNIIGIISSYKNITPIKQAFLLYEQNQKRFEALAHTCPVGIFECDPDHRLTYVNPEWERITGVAGQQAIGSLWTAFVAREHLPSVQHLLENAESQPGSDRLDCMLRGDRECMVELSLNRVSDTINNTVSYIGSVVDLTDRLAAQQQLRDHASLLHDLTKSVPAIIWQLAANRRCVFASGYWEVLTGSPTASAMDRKWESFIHRNDLPHVQEALDAVLARKLELSRIEFRLRDSDGNWRWMLSHCQPIHSSDGAFLGLAGHMIDITDRRKAEIELQEYNALLEQRVEERTQELLRANASLLNEMESHQHAQELLEEKQAQLAHFSRVSIMGQLSGELAHELNQPLNAIQNYVASLNKILQVSPVSDAAAQVLSMLHGEVNRAAKIIRRTREFVSTGKHQVEPIRFLEMVTDTAAMLKGEARRRGLKIEIANHATNDQSMGDPIRLQQVLVNLVLNALESMVGEPASSKIATIELQSIDNHSISIAVHDTGCGVDESQRKKLFEAFFTTKSTGLGMGLAISRGIIEEHGGTLDYQPRSEGGSTFRIVLPLATEFSP